MSCADTYTHKKTGESFTGFTTTKKVKKLSVVKSAEKGTLKINLKDYKIVLDNKGRKDYVVVIPLRNGIEFMAETEAFCKAIEKNVNKGVKLIIIDVDSPGGSVMMCKKICKFITGIKSKCPIAAYISGGEMNGAISAAAGVSLACPSIYMAPETTIGAATPWMMTKYGIKESAEGFRMDFSNLYGKLAEGNGKPRLIAMAMVDKNFDVIEYKHDGIRYFASKELKSISPKPKNTVDKEDGTYTYRFPENVDSFNWSKIGEVLTLSAQEALKSGICDSIASTKFELVEQLGLSGAKLITDPSPLKARKGIQKAEKRVNATTLRIEKRISSFNNSRMTYKEAVSQLNKMHKEVSDAVGLADKYPEINVNRDRLYELKDIIESILNKL